MLDRQTSVLAITLIVLMCNQTSMKFSYQTEEFEKDSHHHNHLYHPGGYGTSNSTLSRARFLARALLHWTLTRTAG